VITAWIVGTVVSKSLTNVLIETFITDWSSTMTNCAVASATSGHQRFTAFSSGRRGLAPQRVNTVAREAPHTSWRAVRREYVSQPETTMVPA